MQQYIGEEENPEEEHNTHWRNPPVVQEFKPPTIRMRLAYCTSCSTTATDHELPMTTLEVGDNTNTFWRTDKQWTGHGNKPDRIRVFFICRSSCHRTTTTPCAALKQRGTIISKQPLNWGWPVRRRPKSGSKTSSCHQASYGEHLKPTQILGDTTSIA